MSRSTSWNSTPGQERVSMQDCVYGEGRTAADALQSVLDNMEKRVEQIREELARARAQGPYR